MNPKIEERSYTTRFSSEVPRVDSIHWILKSVQVDELKFDYKLTINNNNLSAKSVKIEDVAT